jgi:hypothetical protein
MPRTDRGSDPDQGLLDSVESEGDGIGPTLGPDLGANAAADAKRRRIERQVYQRRTAADREAEAQGPANPHTKGV